MLMRCVICTAIAAPLSSRVKAGSGLQRFGYCWLLAAGSLYVSSCLAELQ
jgi:hypothetical protein